MIIDLNGNEQTAKHFLAVVECHGVEGLQLLHLLCGNLRVCKSAMLFEADKGLPQTEPELRSLLVGLQQTFSQLTLNLSDNGQAVH